MNIIGIAVNSEFNIMLLHKLGLRGYFVTGRGVSMFLPIGKPPNFPNFIPNIMEDRYTIKGFMERAMGEA